MPQAYRDPIPTIILLSGPTSAGKTSLAQALQKRLSTVERPFLHVEADQFAMPVTPKDWSEKNNRSRFYRAFRQSVMAYAHQGFDLIIDGILPYGDKAGIEETLETYGEYSLCYVAVHCDLEELEKRILARSDRSLDFGRQQFQNLHEGQVYDVEVDTTIHSPEEAADRVAVFLEKRDS